MRSTKKPKKIMFVALLFMIIIAAAGVFAYLQLQKSDQTQTKSQQTESTQEEINQAETEKSEQSLDSVVLTNTFNSEATNLRFNYPDDWTITPIDLPDYAFGDYENIELASASGFTLTFKAVIAQVGGGCSPDDAVEFTAKKIAETTATSSDSSAVSVLQYTLGDTSSLYLVPDDVITSGFPQSVCPNTAFFNIVPISQNTPTAPSSLTFGASWSNSNEPSATDLQAAAAILRTIAQQ